MRLGQKGVYWNFVIHDFHIKSPFPNLMFRHSKPTLKLLSHVTDYGPILEFISTHSVSCVCVHLYDVT
jgi:hypothetical protein